ncbi:MAG: hypothetical protein H6835_18670 [Planctomycetes bacterium]|nr:hypothetical protein [Planctomycetota bacterium]
MKLHQVWASLGLFTFCTACGTVGEHASPPELEFAAAPMVETASVEDEVAASFTLQQHSRLGAGTFVGDVWLEQPRMELAGAGAEQTVIDGNLTLASQCRVEHLTVTGDLIFAGNNARAVDVRCLGQVLDYGTCNRH